MGDLSAHFSTSEFRCHGFGHPGHPQHPTIVSSRLVAHLELLRAAVRRPIVIVSGHRCVWWNRRVGGAVASQHLTGQAADVVPGLCNVPQAERAGFHGIGVHNGAVIHLDVRPGPVVIFKD